jgi:hypothetical protein
MTHPFFLKLAIAQRYEQLLNEAGQWRLARAQSSPRSRTPPQGARQALRRLGERFVRWAGHWATGTPIEQH